MQQPLSLPSRIFLIHQRVTLKMYFIRFPKGLILQFREHFYSEITNRIFHKRNDFVVCAIYV